MSSNPTDALMFTAILPFVAKKHPKYLEQIPEGTSHETIMEYLADLRKLPKPETWADLQRLIKAI